MQLNELQTQWFTNPFKKFLQCRNTLKKKSYPKKQ